MKTRISPFETRISASVVLKNGQQLPDEAYERIEELTSQYLLLVATDESGWDQLFGDPQDGRLWKKIYEDSHLHGSGAPYLEVVGEKEALDTFGYSVV